MKEGTMLEAINLTKVYEDGLVAVDKMNLKVENGEIFCLLGANGAGKTTAINLFLNFISPTEGTALIDETDVTKEPLKSKNFVAYVSENVMLYGNFTARQNLDYFTKLAGKKNVSKTEYYDVLKRVGLQEEAFEMKVKNFSKGMRQKTGIAIAILKDAPNIILDEPTSGLDPKAGAEFLTLLEQLRDEGKAILMSTHDIFRAKTVADKIGIMKEGKIALVKTKDELIKEDLNKLYIEYMQEKVTV